MHKDFKASDDQLAIKNELVHTTNNIIVGAMAGSGKTTTLEYICKYVPKHKNSIFLAFNKAIVEELKKRVPSNIQASTIHSFCAKLLYQQFGRIVFNENKVFGMALKMFKNSWSAGSSYLDEEGETVNSLPIDEPKYTYCYRVAKLVDLMRVTLSNDIRQIQELSVKHNILIFGPECEHAMELYKACYKRIDQIDYTDMVFQVAIRDIKLPKYDYVFVDEIQDLNKAQQTIIKKIIRPNTGRLIGVGDPRQSIYGFAGADFESYQRLKTLLPNTVELPLSTCYRCSKNVVRAAQTVVPEIQFFEHQEEGIAEFAKEGCKISEVTEIQAGDWVLCRNIRPLVVVFRMLIQQGKKANIKGREIGENLVNILNKTKKKTVMDALKILEVYKIKIVSKVRRYGYAKPDEHPQVQEINDKIAITKILSNIEHPEAEDRITSLPVLINRIQKVFLDEDIPGIVLSTIHKAKGLEANRVFILNPELMPSKFARTEEDFLQESNLKYVAITRAKKELYTIVLTPEQLKG